MSSHAGREQILDSAKTLISVNRDKDYGDASVNFARIAQLWSVIFGQDVASDQVALAMAAVKMARLVETPSHFDSWVDLAGYAALGGEVSVPSVQCPAPPTTPST